MAKVKVFTSSKEDYNDIMEAAQAKMDELLANRPKNKISPFAFISYVGEILFGMYLDKVGISHCEPQVEGQTRNNRNADFGDYQVDGLIYDCKVSTKHDNILIKPRVDTPIDYFVGIRITKNVNRTFTIHINGVVHLEDVKEVASRKQDGGYLVLARDLEEL